ncbi:MAG: hypothetical protein WA666_03840 [Nitrospirota bacterium]
MRKRQSNEKAADIPVKVLSALTAFLLIFYLTKASGTEAYRTAYTCVYYDSIENFDAFEQDMSPLFHRSRGPTSPYLSRKIDKTVEDVESFLDMYPKNFKVNIVLLVKRGDLQKKYDRGGGDKNVLGFFQQSSRTIYVSVDDVTPKILTHEVAHAIISDYFKGTAPPNTQEILAISAGEEVEE